ncbi:hypothetical protein, partial [Nonomuraea roseola]
GEQAAWCLLGRCDQNANTIPQLNVIDQLRLVNVWSSTQFIGIPRLTRPGRPGQSRTPPPQQRRSPSAGPAFGAWRRWAEPVTPG